MNLYARRPLTLAKTFIQPVTQLVISFVLQTFLALFQLRDFHANPLPDLSPEVLQKKKYRSPTKPEPFRLEVDDRGAKRAEGWSKQVCCPINIFEWGGEESYCRWLAKKSSRSLLTRLNNTVPTQVSIIWSLFQLEENLRKGREMATFKAKPADVLKHQPFVPTRSTKPLTGIQDSTTFKVGL